MLAEIDDVLGGRRPTAADLTRLPWTTACVQESQRYYSAVWIIAREAIEDDIIDGHHIRAGTTVLIPIHHIHHDERWWPDPEVFDPTRFLGDAAKDRPRSAYLPFGGGRRICIGQSFALMEMVLMAAIMSQRFTFDVCPDHPVELEATLTLRPKHGLHVIAHRRESPRTRGAPVMKTVPDYDTVIVGAGFSGIGTAIKLDKAGMGDYLVIEAGEGPGGTWYWNTYPGIAVDIPSFSYQFSFEKSPNWTRTYAPGQRTEGLRRALRRQVRPAPEDPVQHQGARRDVRRRREPVAHRARHRRRGHRPVPGQRQRGADHAEPARHRRRRLVRRADDAHRAVGPRPGPDRQARRDHRDRRLRGAGHPRDRANCRAASPSFSARLSGASPSPTCRCRP